MAIYMKLFCPETKLMIWLGDWREWGNPFGHQLHSVGRDEDIRTLERFLAMHRGKELRYLHDVDATGVLPDAVDFSEEHWNAWVEEMREAEMKRFPSSGDPLWEDKWDRPDYSFEEKKDGK